MPVLLAPDEVVDLEVGPYDLTMGHAVAVIEILMEVGVPFRMVLRDPVRRKLVAHRAGLMAISRGFEPDLVTVVDAE